MEKAKETNDDYEKRKYLRAAAVFYVTCVDAWLAQKAYELLNNKSRRGLELDSKELAMLKNICPIENVTMVDSKCNINVPDRRKMVNMIYKLNGNSLDSTKCKNYNGPPVKTTF